MFDLYQRQLELKNNFTIGQDIVYDHSSMEIRFMPFLSNFNYDGYTCFDNSFTREDANIDENRKFYYPIFKPLSKRKFDKAILLLHGLNERSWDKYLCWAEFLCHYTQRPIVLFPLAFHMNRSQSGWLNIRNIFKNLPLRLNKKQANDTVNDTVSVVNYVLSERLSENPIRFYTSGKQSLEDVTTLVKDMKSGRHPFFNHNCQVDIFAYSIGAMLTQILLMANPNKLFSDTRALLFCGGALFEKMNGLSKNIMDKVCFKALHAFYTDRCRLEQIFLCAKDEINTFFSSMLMQEVNKDFRYAFFKTMGDKIKIISLQKDKVISYSGIVAAVGKDYAIQHVIEMDYDYAYSHEQPFPLLNQSLKDKINDSFNKTFTIIGDFFNLT